MRIEADHLTLRYGTTTAVDDCSFRLDGPKIYGLLGRNGSGKTSLLSMLAAFRRPSAGDVLIDGQPVFENADAVRQICFIRGAGDTVERDFPEDRVRNALAFAADFRPNWDQSVADHLVDRFELPATSRLSQLSRGQRSAVGIVLGLAAGAPLTIFDESYLGLDAPSRYVFYDELLAEMMARPRTFIISTHLIEEVASLFEEVVMIDEGQLLLHESTDSLREHGVSVTGPADAVDRFSSGRRLLDTKQLGPTKQTMVYGPVDDADRAEARESGLALGPIALQDLFVYLTQAAAPDSAGAGHEGGVR